MSKRHSWFRVETEDIPQAEGDLLGDAWTGRGCHRPAAKGDSSVCERPRRDNLVKLTENPV